MNIGLLRQRVTIYTREQIEEANGAGVFTLLTPLKTIWADFDAINGLVKLDYKQIGENITHRITIRYFPGLSTEHWLKLGKRNFQILTIKNLDERNIYLELMLREVFIDQAFIQAGTGQAGDPIES